MKYFLIIYQAIMARTAGGGIWPGRPGGVPEWLFSAPIAYVFYLHFPLAYLALSLDGTAALHIPAWILSLAWTFGWMQTGHGTAFGMGSNPDEAKGTRKEDLSFVIDHLCGLFRQPLGEAFYCWTFMGLKGFLIHLPLGWYALPAAVMWPGAYWIGNNIIRGRFHPKIDGNTIAELTAGACSGLLVALAWGLHGS